MTGERTLAEWEPSAKGEQSTPRHMSSFSTTGREYKDAAADFPAPFGNQHLHLVCPSGRWIWVVRTRAGAICKTDRCQLVGISCAACDHENGEPCIDHVRL